MRPLPTHYYHAVPLYRVPYLLRTGALYAHATLQEKGIPLGPRPTVARRDRKLRLSGYVHLALELVTPLLRDKLKKGYPHALLEFAEEIVALPGTAYLRFNPKSWRHREDFAPVLTAEEKAEFLEAWQQGQYPSAELLVPESLPLSGNVRKISLCSEAEQQWLEEWRELVVPTTDFPPVTISPILPPCTNFDWTPFRNYTKTCREAGIILPPPDLPFD